MHRAQNDMFWVPELEPTDVTRVSRDSDLPFAGDGVFALPVNALPLCPVRHLRPGVPATMFVASITLGIARVRPAETD